MRLTDWKFEGDQFGQAEAIELSLTMDKKDISNWIRRLTAFQEHGAETVTLKIIPNMNSLPKLTIDTKVTYGDLKDGAK